MPTYTARSHQRNLALRRKGAHEVSFLEDENEDIVFGRPSQPLKSKPGLVHVDQTSDPGSPVSVASAVFDESSQLKPLVLPGAWVTVGKGGKPLKNEKMYEEPVTVVGSKKKKKKRTRQRKAEAEPESPLIVILEEVPSSSKCLQSLERSTTQRSKAVRRSKEAKYWAGYQHAKQLKRSALDELVAALVGVELAESDDLPSMAARKPPKDNKANSSKDKIRRRARDAKLAARSVMHDDSDQEAHLPASVERETARVARAVLEAGDEAPTEVKLPGAWTTIGKRGRALSDFPPLKADMSKHRTEHGAEGSGAKQHKSLPAQSGQSVPMASSADIKRGKSGKQIKCSVM